MNPTDWSEAPSHAFGATLITQAVKYAGASGDFNPLHHDLETARRAGFEAIVVHGSLNAARLAHVLATQVGVEGLSEFAVRFERPALLGDPLAAAWRRADDVVDMTLFREQTGQQVVSAQARYGGWSLDPDGPGDYRALGDPYPWPVELGAARFFDEAVSGEAARPENGRTISVAFVGTCIRWTPAKESVVRRLGFDFSRMLHGSQLVPAVRRAYPHRRNASGHRSPRQLAGAAASQRRHHAHGRRNTGYRGCRGKAPGTSRATPHGAAEAHRMNELGVVANFRMLHRRTNHD